MKPKTLSGPMAAPRINVNVADHMMYAPQARIGLPLSLVRERTCGKMLSRPSEKTIRTAAFELAMRFANMELSTVRLRIHATELPHALLASVVHGSASPANALDPAP